MRRAHTPCPPAEPIVTGDNRLAPGNWCWRESGIDDWLIAYTRGGRPRFRWEGGELFAEPGSIVLIRPGARHDYGLEPGDEPWDCLWAVFRPWPHWLDSLRWPEVWPGTMYLSLRDRSVHDAVLAKLDQMHRYATGALPQGRMLAMNALEAALLLCEPANPLRAVSRQDRRVRRAVEYICRNLAEPLDAPALAGVAGVSVPQLVRLFRRTLGMSPMQYVEHQRIGRAREMLQFTSMSIQEVAAEVGYDDPFYFSTRFRRATGLSPRRFRMQQAVVAKPSSSAGHA
jgi:AraC family transcriptional regulator of arabinose operon